MEWHIFTITLLLCIICAIWSYIFVENNDDLVGTFKGVEDEQEK